MSQWFAHGCTRLVRTARPVFAAVAVSLALALGIGLAGCTPGRTIEDPYAVMLDRESEWTARRAAARQAFAHHRDDPELLATLNKVIYSGGYPPWQRQEAVDMLVAIDESAFRRALGTRILAVPDRETLSHIYDLAIQRRWSDFTPLAVRCYARHDPLVADAVRPERRVIRALNPGREIEEVIFAVFIEETGEQTAPQQVAAWDLLFRLRDADEVARLLEAAPATPFVQTLRRARRELGILPRNREEVLWLMHLQQPQAADWWRRAAQMVARLSPAQRQGLELRHLPVLMQLDAAMFIRRRSVLIAEIAVQLGRAEHHFKNPDEESEQKIAPNAARLTWADLAVIHTLINLLQDRDLQRRLFEQADEDHEDRTTEYGGVIAHDPDTGSIVSRRYRPLLRRGDDVFIPPQIMIEHLYTGLYHYHFHVQSHDHGAHAGPGDGDLEVAARMPFNFFVLTAIDADRLNVDYYQRSGVVIDLVTLRRGGGGRELPGSSGDA